MMKLILSLTLIWTLSSTAEALKCWHGLGTDTKQQALLPCNSTDLCATLAYQVNTVGDFTISKSRSCLPSSLFSEGKHAFSFYRGFESRAATVHVCSTDGCNDQVIPYPGTLKRNNLQCFTCDDRFSAACNNVVKCFGEQDRCINGTVADNEGKTLPVSGCISANLCEIGPLWKYLPLLASDVKLLSGPKCCESSFCNSAWSVKLNVIPLLFGLITLIIY
ncbi:uncharacterized protein LOC122988681 [Thunnus albacares]|uniref:uncharacterized protein LOC122988681 n=1 Tax=Thunnus albacares TaxID=8236 RepID=UPI001CF6816E|nr:uncharacterized protein LOC122988681 [Thunnus albacares]